MPDAPLIDINERKGGPCSFDPNAALGPLAETIRAAASGDLAAQRHMRNLTTDAIGVTPATAPLALVLGVESLPYARLCAAHENADKEDARRLAGALCFTFVASHCAGFGDSASALAGEAVAILERLADDGDETSAFAAVEIVGFYPQAGEIARRLLRGEG